MRAHTAFKFLGFTDPVVFPFRGPNFLNKLSCASASLLVDLTLCSRIFSNPTWDGASRVNFEFWRLSLKGTPIAIFALPDVS